MQSGPNVILYMLKPGDIVVPNIQYKEYHGARCPDAELFEVVAIDEYDPNECIELCVVLPVGIKGGYEHCFPWRFDLIHRPNV